jgi:hypothetical protein
MSHFWAKLRFSRDTALKLYVWVIMHVYDNIVVIIATDDRHGIPKISAYG